jgi:hypothetical protein
VKRTTKRYLGALLIKHLRLAKSQAKKLIHTTCSSLG